MRYLIDGYNLLHAMGVLAGPAGPHGLEKARVALFVRLAALHADDPGSVTVVFDAANAPAGVKHEQEYHGLHVLFTHREEADDLIETLIQRDPTPQRLTIVSDDRRLREAARRRHCPALGCLDYLEQAGRKPPEPVAGEVPAKPDQLTPEETRSWLETFGDLADDPAFKDLVELNGPPDEDG